MRWAAALSATVAVVSADRDWTVHTLSDSSAVCLDGSRTTIKVDVGDPSVWVVQLGGASPGLDFCVDETTCALFASEKPGPPPAPGPIVAEGPQSGNCTVNPDWCKASQAEIPLCDMALLMGSATADHNGTTMHFQGIKILASAVKDLAALGLSKAKKVLLTGVAHGGTAVYLHADRISAAVKQVAPGAEVMALPVDGFHANLFQTFFCTSGIMKSNCFGPDGTPRHVPTWYPNALWANSNLSGAAANVAPGCAQRVGSGNEYLCLFANETIPHITTPLFAVNQLISVWDAQCMSEGEIGGPPVLQVMCSERGNYFKDQYTCVQYPDLCNPTYIKDWWAPSQQQYLDDFTRSGAHKKPGNGGFFHQCYLGSYFESDFGSTSPKVPRGVNGIWNEIAVGGKTMRQAVSSWWAGGESGAAEFYSDKVWDPAGQPPPGASTLNANWTVDDVYAPTVPWYTARWMTNPTCRGFPWY